ncbi:MAG: methylenetetrahydrofolate reductase [NAD(P)H] [Deltaproteobacteria bacterium]|nr:methylenetetrahydrofolate reductase [NAD(P)H] [Deltaproteobacteria bacterium]
MKLTSLNSTQAHISFELFPPKNLEAEKSLYHHLESLIQLNPAFFSVTMGAMGSNKGNTLQIVHQIESKYQIPGVAHLTCVNATRDNILEIIEELRSLNITNLLCLRGDPPLGHENFTPPKNGFRYANELVSFVRENTGDEFTLGVAGYPEGHIESPSLQTDLQNLKIKIDSGADFIITQLFFDNNDFFRYADEVQKIKPHLPLLPGIMPISGLKQLERFIKVCGAKIPKAVSEHLEKIKNDSLAIKQFGVDYAAQQSRNLIENGFKQLHFYTLNQSEMVTKIYNQIQDLL